MIIEDKLQGEPPSKAIWYNVRRDKNDNIIIYPYVRNKWISDHINIFKSKYSKTKEPVNITVHFVTRTPKLTSELFQAFEYICKNVFIYDVEQIQNIHITKEISEPNDKSFKACIHNFTIETI